MFGSDLVIRTKFIPPRLRPPQIERQHLYRLLEGVRQVPLAILAAGTGYGKSTLLAGYLAASRTPFLWYELTGRDADPLVWLVHLAHLCERSCPGVADRALHLLSRPGGAERHGEAAIEALADALLDRIQEDTWLVLDDAHWLQDSPTTLNLLNHLVRFLPPLLHLVVASRRLLELADLPRWRLRGELLLLEQPQLAFQKDDLGQLWLALQGAPPSEEQAARILEETEGWPIAVQLLARRGAEAPGEGGPAELFAYLVREVLDKLDETDRQFLLRTAPLRLLTVSVCNDVTNRSDAARVMRRLSERGLFLVTVGRDTYRYHHLFREFLLHQLDLDGTIGTVRQAAARTLARLGEPEEALEHYLDADCHEDAADLLLLLAPILLKQGRHDQMAAWLQCLPPDWFDRRPDLALIGGDVCRQASQFAAALDWYERALRELAGDPAGSCRVLIAQARVYLDTIQPARVEQLLEEALDLAPDSIHRADILLLLAENKINRGEARAAESLLQRADRARPQAVEQEARLLLRSGRLQEGRALLRTAMEEPGGPVRGTGGHREAALVLSLIESFRGEPAEARRLAELALEWARLERSGWTEAVALMRLAHARLLAGEADAAEAAYRAALVLADALAIPRLRAEPLWGLVLLAGNRGDGNAADALAHEGLNVARHTGDGWMAALLALARGRAGALAGDGQADASLAEARADFERSGDTYGQALAALWSAYLALQHREGKTALQRLRTLLDFVRTHDYPYLLARPVLMGFPTVAALEEFLGKCLAAGLPPALLQPWLPKAVDREPERPAAKAVLAIHCLGTFRVHLSGKKLQERAWGRAKARQLLHILLAFRGQQLDKERLIEMLWPDTDPEAGDRSFRVALNALNKALEPDRPAGRAPRFILRRGHHYTLAADPLVQLDVRPFERLLDAAGDVEAAGGDPVPLYTQALELYEGAFLADYTAYDTWCDRERERLAARYSTGVLRLLRLLASQGDDAACGRWAERVIEQDPCAEEAYRILMTVHERQGHRSLALRAYERCAAALHAELDTDPLPETVALADRIRAGHSPPVPAPASLLSSSVGLHPSPTAEARGEEAGGGAS